MHPSQLPAEDRLAPGFMIVHGNQPELLRQLLVQWYKAHPLAPLEDEIILVQSNGIAQWLKLALATTASGPLGGGCGIAAALDMLLPSRFEWQAYRAVLGDDEVPATSPFDKSRLLWRLLRLLPALIAEPGYEPLARFLEGDGDWRRRYQLAEKIADLFDQYQVYRADWLDTWANGGDTLPDGRGGERPLDATQRWQAMLWRTLLADVGEASRGGRAAVHQRFLEAAAALERRPAALPRRVAVFGLTTLPRQSLDVLLAIAKFSQVLLCVNNPCQFHWADMVSTRDHLRRLSGRHRRKAGAPAALTEDNCHLHHHPLLASWGKQGRDYIAQLDELDQPELYRQRFDSLGERIDLFNSHGDGCLLNQLQDDIRLLRAADESRQSWPPVDPARDGSIRFHIAHSPQREVEILHDQLLAAFAADPSLRPRDIIVMAPDIDAYAPHIAAVFGQIERSDDRHIPFAIADLSQHQAPLVAALTFLLQMPEARFTVTDILDLLDVPAVRQRLGLAPADLPVLHQWIRDTGIRWGLDGRQRAGLLNLADEQNTWRQGLKQMLLGYAVGSDPTGREERAWRDIEPYGEVGGLDAALVGPLSRLVVRLDHLSQTLVTPASAAHWGTRLQALLQDFFLAESAADMVLLGQMQTSLENWVESCGAAGLTEAIPLPVVRDHWLAQLDSPSLNQRFMTGHLTFATLRPMRAIPFRRVCVLGLHDGAFPRSQPPVDFDLMAQAPRPGDRSRRDDDRYLFLEALLSAREHLHLSWVGRSIQDNAEQPPSVLISQLRDHIAACWRLAGGDGDDSGEGLVAALTVEHPLQPFSPRYFTAGDGPLFTYAREWEHGSAIAAVDDDAPLPPPALDAAITLDQLAAFLKDPVKHFYRERLRIFYEQEDTTAEDQEPFALDNLEQWSLQDRLIRARLDALRHDPADDGAAAVTRQLARIRRRGELPLGALADLVAEELSQPLDEMFTRYSEARAPWPEALEPLSFEYLHHDGGRQILIQGTLGDRYGAGEQWCRIELNSSNLVKGKQYRRDKLLGQWVLHLAANLTGQPVTTQVIGKNGLATLNPLDPEQADGYFRALVNAYLGGLCRPLPLAAAAGFAWLMKDGTAWTGPLEGCTQAAADKAREAYEGGYNSSGDVTHNPYLQRCYPTFAALWRDGEFTRLCNDLYLPLKAHLGQNGTAT